MKEEELREDEKKKEMPLKDILYDLLDDFSYKEEAERRNIVKDYFRLIQKDAFKDDPEGYKEAAPELEKYLDDAYMAHLPSVRIVHGKGTGALRKAVHEKLRTTSFIREYRLGAYGEGDAGVTAAALK